MWNFSTRYEIEMNAILDIDNYEVLMISFKKLLDHKHTNMQ